ncbi:MAG: fumarate hydratase, partial [Lachnospiraceae bacterium]|nr:fumarate hydratase [Lachnospiraceae bacterium]
MREVSCKKITEAVKRLSIESNCFLNSDIYNALKEAKTKETSPVGQEFLSQLIENADIAREKNMPVCQDTGVAVIFIEMGQEVHITDGYLADAVNEGVRQGYIEGYLRKSVVGDPILRKNTNDNTPAVIHYNIVEGDSFKITVAPKGIGSENMSKIFMLKPSDGIDGIKKAVLDTVEEAGPNPCPPVIVGVGIGGNFEKCALIAKQALLRSVGENNPLPHIAQLEKELLEEVNRLGIGPQGLGGKTTALAVNIEVYPTHIAECLLL